MRFLAVFLLLLFSYPTSYARIDESKAECEKRYGKPQKKEPAKPGYDEARIYVKNNMAIMVGFQGDQAVLIIYTKFKDREVLPLSDVEVNTLLEANANGKKWIPDPRKKDDWRRVDDRRAYYGGKSLVVYSPPYAKEVEKDARTPKNLKGF